MTESHSEQIARVERLADSWGRHPNGVALKAVLQDRRMLLEALAECNSSGEDADWSKVRAVIAHVQGVHPLERQSS
jgi:hypothetical protein